MDRNKNMSIQYKSTLIICAGKRIPLQSHDFSELTWKVVSGYGLLNLDSESSFIRNGCEIFIPNMCKYRLTNLSTEDLIIDETRADLSEEVETTFHEDDN